MKTIKELFKYDAKECFPFVIKKAQGALDNPGIKDDTKFVITGLSGNMEFVGYELMYDGTRHLQRCVFGDSSCWEWASAPIKGSIY